MRHKDTKTRKDYFSRVDSEEAAYLLGFITADGNVTKCGYYLRIVLARRDAEHLEKIRDILAPGATVSAFARTIKGSEYDFCGLCIGSKQIVSDLASHGVTPAKSLTAMPWDGPSRLMKHYWRGVFDGDGSLYPNEGTFGLNLTGTEHITSAFATFAKIKNVPCRAGRAKLVATRNLDDVQRICRLLYDGSTIFLRRKKETADAILVHRRKILLGEP